MSNIENLFKHKFPLNFGKCGTRMEVPTTNTLYYGIDTIKNGNSIGVYSIDDVFNKLKPFLSYLQSVIITENTVRGIQLLNITYRIMLRVNDETYDVGSLSFREPLLFCAINFMTRGGEPNINFSNINVKMCGERSNMHLRSSFGIFLWVFKRNIILPEEGRSNHFYDEDDFESDNESEEVESENEYNDHPIPPKPLEESFRIDKCVIYLENEPNILFNDCVHICTCFECEKIKPSVKCPYCRTKISRRIKI